QGRALLLDVRSEVLLDEDHAGRSGLRGGAGGHGSQVSGVQGKRIGDLYAGWSRFVIQKAMRSASSASLLLLALAAGGPANAQVYADTNAGDSHMVVSRN